MRRVHLFADFVFSIIEQPDQSPEPTAVGVPRLRDSAIAVHVASRRWLSFFRYLALSRQTARPGITKISGDTRP